MVLLVCVGTFLSLEKQNQRLWWELYILYNIILLRFSVFKPSPEAVVDLIHCKVAPVLLLLVTFWNLTALFFFVWKKNLSDTKYLEDKLKKRALT